MKAPVRFGPYRLLDRIALGGMAEVFLALRPGVEGFEKQLAIKRIRPQLSGEEAFIRMFLHEARLAARLHHPNIVQIFDLGHIDGAYFIAMEHISGRDMSRTLPKAAHLGIPFPLEYAVHIAIACLDGLAYAHTKRDDDGRPLDVVHRDVTPENIMVSWTGTVKLLDFGIAKAATQTDLTKAGQIKGKLSYMSPEQATGRPVDARSDIFSMGVVLYEWLTGYKLFNGENDMAVLKSVVEGRVYPPSYFRDDIPDEVEDALMRALEKDPTARHSSARDMQYALQQWLHRAEFTPSSTHLANFMKQIFADELEADRVRWGAARRALTELEGPSGPRVSAPPAESEEPGGWALAIPSPVVEPRGAPLPRDLRLTLDPDLWVRLEEAAGRRGVSVEVMVAELLTSLGRFL